MGMNVARFGSGTEKSRNLMVSFLFGHFGKGPIGPLGTGLTLKCPENIFFRFHGMSCHCQHLPLYENDFQFQYIIANVDESVK